MRGCVRRSVYPVSVLGLALLPLILSGCNQAIVPEADSGDAAPSVTESQGAALTPVSHAQFVPSVEEIEQTYFDAGAESVTIYREGSVDDGCCLITEALSDGDPAGGPDALYEGASISVTVTSDATMPDVAGLDPLAATDAVREAGLEPSPAFNSYERPSGSTDPEEPRVVSASVAAGEAARVGDAVELAYDKPLDGYSWTGGHLVTLP